MLTQDKVVAVEWVVTLDRAVAWAVEWVVAVDTTTTMVAKAVACRYAMAREQTALTCSSCASRFC